MANKYTVTLIRETEITVTVGFQEGSGQTWFDPGDPEEWWIEESINQSSGEVVDLDCTETEAAIKLAIKTKRER